MYVDLNYFISHSSSLQYIKNFSDAFIAMSSDFKTWNFKPLQGCWLGLFPTAKSLAAE